MTRPGFLAIDLITHRAALVGRAIDKIAQTPLPGVEVVITSGPAAWLARVAAVHQGRPSMRPDLRVTDSAGAFRWLDLPAGAYNLGAIIPGTRYGNAVATATVVTGGPVSAELALAPTMVTGIITAGAPVAPLAMARVRFADSGDIAYTAADGSFTLSPVEAGVRVLEVSAQNYITTTQTVTLSMGQTATAPIITLTHS
jgi:hypothetical protein